MTVAELKKELEQFDDDLDVVIDCNGEYHGQDIDKGCTQINTDNKVHISTGCYVYFDDTTNSCISNSPF